MEPGTPRWAYDSDNDSDKTVAYGDTTFEDVLDVVEPADASHGALQDNYRRAFVIAPQDNTMDEDDTTETHSPPDTDGDAQVPFDHLVRQSLHSIVDTGADMWEFLRQATPLLDPLREMLRSHQGSDAES